MVTLTQAPEVALAFILVAAFFVAGLLVVDGLREDVCDSGFNATDGTCTTPGDGFLAIGNVTEGMANVTSYAPTWGTLIGVGILLSIIVGAFAIGRARGRL